MKKDSKSDSSANLRQKAEELYNKKLQSSGAPFDVDQAQKLLQELEVHQIELELQNQEILLTKEQIVADADKYSELFDFAPLGYFTLSKEGEIIEINLFGLQMLGKERSLLKHSRFGFFVSDDSKSVFNLFLDKLLKNRSKETCEVNLSVNGDVPMIVELIGIANVKKDQCLVIATDITQRKQEEAELVEKEVQYYNLANAGIALTWTSGTNKLCNYFNEAWLKFTGRTLEQELGNGWAEGVHPDDLDRCLSIYATAFDRREPFEMEYRLHHVSGEYRWIIDIGTPNYNSSKEFIGYIGNCFDITQRKQMEEALRENEEKYRTLLDNSDIGIGVLSLEGKILWYNQIALRNIGGEADDIIGKTLAEVFGEQAASVFVERIQNVAKSESNAVYEELVKLSSGNRWYLSNYSRLRDPDGIIRSVQVIAMDITDRKQAEESLFETNELFSLFLKHSPIYTFIKEVNPEESRVLKASENFSDMIGISGSTMVGKTMYELFPADLAAKITADDWMVVSKGEVLKMDEDLNDRNYTSIKYPITLGGRTLLAGYTIDITDRKQAEEKIKYLSRHFQALIENAPDGVVLLDVDGNFRFISPAAKRIFGFQPSEEIVGNPAEYTHPDDLNMVLSALSGIIEDSSYLPTLQYRYRDKTGNWLWVESTFKNLLADPSVESILINFRDITTQKQAEEGLKQSNIQLELAHKSAGAGAWDWDILSQHLNWSKELYQMFGLDPDAVEASFAVWNQVVHPDDLAYASKFIEQAIKEKAPLNSEYRVLHPNGQVHWINALGNTTYDDFGQPIRMAGICTDITARKQTEEALHTSEEQYRSLFNNFLDSVAVHQIVLDETGKPVDYIFIQVNEAFTRQTGLCMADILGKRVTEVIPGIEKTPLIGIYGKVAITGEPVIFEQFFEPLQRYFHINAFRVGEGRFCTVFLDVTDARFAEKTLEESEERFRTIFEQSVIGKSMTTLDGKLQINQAFCTMLGYSKDQLSQMDWPSITHPDDVKNDQAIINSIISGEKVNARWEKRYIHKNGSIVWADISTTLQRDHEGKPLFFNTSVIDITERKRIEKALIESEQKFRDTVTNLDEGYYSVTMDGELLEHNQAFCRILGFNTTTDLKGVHLPDFWQHPEERKEYLNAFSTNGSISNYLINIKTKTGAGKTVLASAHLVKDNNDLPLRIEGVFLDITERIRLEEALQRHSGRLQNLHKIDKAILSAVETPEAIIQKTLHHIRSLLSSQHASIGMFDFENEVLQLFCSNIRDQSIDVAKRYLISNALGDLEILREKKMDVVENISLRSLPPDLQRIFHAEGVMSCINVPLISGDKLIGAMNLGWEDPRTFTPEELEIAGEVADEITVAIEQVRLRQAAKHYAEELEKRVEKRTSQLLAANKELEAFSYSVSHDLRAPLRHINGYISILSKHLKDILPEKEKHYFDTITDSARQMGKLIDDLLHFSRTGRQEMLLTSLDMNVVLKDALQVIQHESFGRGIKWVVAVLPQVTGDYALLRLVWLNLLSNAVKFGRANIIPQIEIGVVDDVHEFVFFVRDNGVGFDMQYAHKLFGVFERLHSAQEFEGTGIGLANVRRIIQRHGGRTWAEAEVGKGATFYFSLPKG